MKGQYKLLYNENGVDYSGPDVVEIGKIIDTTTNKDVMYINYERDLYKRRGCHVCIEEYEHEDGDYPVGMTDDLHKSCLFEHPEIFLAIMLHELGHYRNGDLFEEGITTEEVQDLRIQAVLSGKIEEHERKADLFSARCVGKNVFMRAMDYLINQRKQRGDDGMEFAIKEFELRKKAIQNMK